MIAVYPYTIIRVIRYILLITVNDFNINGHADMQTYADMPRKNKNKDDKSL